MPYKNPSDQTACARKWHEANRDKISTKVKADRRANPDKYRDYQLRSRFGLTLAQFNGMCDRQGFVCAICQDVLEDATGRGKTLYVDHDHDTDTVRELLCNRCNRGLGEFQDRPERLIAAAAYLIKHRKPLLSGR